MGQQMGQLIVINVVRRKERCASECVTSKLNVTDSYVCKLINKCVVELPIENSHEKMDYLFQKVEEFENKNKI